MKKDDDLFFLLIHVLNKVFWNNVGKLYNNEIFFGILSNYKLLGF